MLRTIVLWLPVIALGLLAIGCRKPAMPDEAPQPEVHSASPPIDDAFWLNLNRRRSDIYRSQLGAAPPVLVVRESHYTFNPTNGMGLHYGWLDGKMANLGISFSELVGYAYGQAGASDMRQSARTEFPDQWTHGHLTNHYDVIVTITNQPKTAMQSAARKLLKEQFGQVWHWAPKETDVLFIRAKDPQLLQSRASTDFTHSQALAELAGELENYFGLPVVDETGATGRYAQAVITH